MNSNTSHIYPAPNGENDHGEGYTGTSDGEGTHALLARYHDSTIDPYTLALGGFLMAIVLC